MDAERQFQSEDSCRQFSEVNAEHFQPTESDRQYSPLNADQQFASNGNGRQFATINNDQQFAPTDGNGQYSSISSDQQFQVDGNRQFSSVSGNQQFHSGEEDGAFSQVEAGKQFSQLSVNEQFNHLKPNERFSGDNGQFQPSLDANNQFSHPLDSNRHFEPSDSSKQFTQVDTSGQFTPEVEGQFPAVKADAHFQPLESERQFSSADSEQFPPDIRNYCTTELVDEETNNGPLDFSLHRAQDLNVKMEIIPLEEGSLSTPRRQKSPRIKLTLRETPEQREKRLREGRERMRRLRAGENPEEREIRLQKARECQERRRQRERIMESAEERERRLSIARERTRLRRAQESPEQRERRLKATRDRLRMKRACETPEERQRRLQRMRDRKQGKTTDDKDFTRRKKRRSKFDQEVERRQTRGISIKYDTFEDDLDEALFHLHNAEQAVYAGGAALPWVTEPEVCLSVDTSQNTVSEPPANQVQAFPENSASVPPPQDLRDQISQHVSNLVLKTDSPPPSADSCVPPKPHKQKIKIFYRKNNSACHQSQDDGTPSPKNVPASKPQEFAAPQLPFAETNSGKGEPSQKADANIAEPRYQALGHIPASQAPAPFRTTQESYSQPPASTYSYSSQASAQNAPPPPPPAVTEGAVFPQRGTEAPLNLHQGSYLYPRYTPPPPYEPPNSTNSAYTASYSIYSQPPMEHSQESTEDKSSRESSDNK